MNMYNHSSVSAKMQFEILLMDFSQNLISYP